MLKIGVTTRNMLVRITELEKQTRADRAAEFSDLATATKRLSEELAEKAKAKKKEAELLVEQAAQLLAIYRSGEESQQIDCLEEYFPSSGEIIVTREDTHEIVDRRRPNEADRKKIEVVRQNEFEFDRPGRKRRAAAAPAEATAPVEEAQAAAAPAEATAPVEEAQAAAAPAEATAPAHCRSRRRKNL